MILKKFHILFSQGTVWIASDPLYGLTDNFKEDEVWRNLRIPKKIVSSRKILPHPDKQIPTISLIFIYLDISCPVNDEQVI